MNSRLAAAAFFFAALSLFCTSNARAADPGAFATFTSGAQAVHGLFTIWQKGGKTYLELAPSQLDKDYMETIVPGNGIAQSPRLVG